MQRRQCALGRDLEDCAIIVYPTCPCGSVEVTAGGLHQPAIDDSAITTVKAVQRRQLAPEGDFVNCATAANTILASPTVLGCPVEVSVSGYNQPAVRVDTVDASSLTINLR